MTTGREEDMGGVCEVVKVNLPFIDSRTFSGEVSSKIFTVLSHQRPVSKTDWSQN